MTEYPDDTAHPDYDDSRPFMVPLLKATRPKTLLAAVVPVWLGFALAHSERGVFLPYLFGVTLATTLCIQIATNFFNDAIDCKKGADTAKRLGPERMAGTGALSPESLIVAAVTFIMVGITISLPLVVARGWPIVAIGVPSLYFTYGYTGGPWPLAYRGLGELFVFGFFGLVAVAGSCYVACGEWLPEALLLGAQVGLLATVLIAVNNARDIEEDRAVDKRTLAARYGWGFARWEVLFCCVAPYLLGVVWAVVFGKVMVGLLPVMGLALSGFVAGLVFKTEPSPVYNKALGLSALAMLNFAILISVALILGR